MQLRAYHLGADSRGYIARSGAVTPSRAVASGDMSVKVDRILELIDHASQIALPAGGTVRSEAHIMNIATHNVIHEWRYNLHKYATLARLQEGWDYSDSQPLNREAGENYLEWLATIADNRMDDAEPMLTDEGNIRIEWRRNGHARIAEIGPDSLYLAALAPDRAHDDAEEYATFDLTALDRFFKDDIIRS